MADPYIKDLVCRKVFLNLHVDEEKVVSYQTQEPFTTMLARRVILPSRGDRT